MVVFYKIWKNTKFNEKQKGTQAIEKVKNQPPSPIAHCHVYYLFIMINEKSCRLLEHHSSWDN